MTTETEVPQDPRGSDPLPEHLEGPVPNAVPVKIHMVNGKTFVVDGIESWAYTEQGVFATGKFDGYSGEKDILVPYERVDYYEMDYPRLVKFLAAKAESE